MADKYIVQGTAENAVFISSAAIRIRKCHAAKQSANLRRTEEINTVLLELWRRPAFAKTTAKRARSTEGRNAVFGQGVTASVTVEDKLHFFYIVLLQFIVVDAIYLECEVAGRVFMSPRVLKVRVSRTSRREAGKRGLSKNDYMASGSCYAHKLNQE